MEHMLLNLPIRVVRSKASKACFNFVAIVLCFNCLCRHLCGWWCCLHGNCRAHSVMAGTQTHFALGVGYLTVASGGRWNDVLTGFQQS